MHSTTRTLLLTAIAMIAFAANSILCRLALLGGSIDAGTFTFLRLFSGSLALLLLIRLKKFNKQNKHKQNYKLKIASSVMLFSYAITFSYAYINIATGTGALILFASVQSCLIISHIYTGNKISKLEFLGLSVSLIGFAYLLLPSATRPDLLSAFLMIISGISWAAFTLLGKKSSSATQSITDSFAFASILALLISPWIVNFQTASFTGLSLAVLSGALASAGGYLIWYYVLPKISVLKASVVQLTVPPFAIIGGAILLNESITLTLLMATTLILGGILLVFISKN